MLDGRVRGDDWRYSVEVTRDGRFRETAAALAARSAEQLGCQPARAVRLGEAVHRLLGWLTALPTGAAPGPSVGRSQGTVTLDFRGVDGGLAVEVWCSDETSVGLKSLLEDAGALPVLAPLVDSAEIADACGHPCCRLTCQSSAR